MTMKCAMAAGVRFHRHRGSAGCSVSKGERISQDDFLGRVPAKVVTNYDRLLCVLFFNWNSPIDKFGGVIE